MLTEQKDNICYPTASVEDARYQKEDDFYNIADARRISKATTGATQASFENKLYRTHGGLTNEKTGLGIVLKVMAGDQVKDHGRIFLYHARRRGRQSAHPGPDRITDSHDRSGAIIANKGSLTPAQVSGIGNNNVDLTNFVSNNNPGANNARAFVNYLLFDENLKYISGGADPVLAGGGYKLHNNYINNPVTIARSGYIYVFVSNESNLPVYFDNLSVTHTPRPDTRRKSLLSFWIDDAGH